MIELTYDDVVKLIEKAKEQDVSYIEVPGMFKAKFKNRKKTLHTIRDIKAQKEIPPILAAMKIDDLMKPLSTLDELSPEEILYYATPHFDELQSEKEAHQQKLKDEFKS